MSKETEAARTPGPYRLGSSGPRTVDILAGYNCVVARVVQDGLPEANVDFFIRAANSHDDLVKALDPDLLEAIADEIQSFEHSARANSLRILAKQQRAALSRARGEA